MLINTNEKKKNKRKRKERKALILILQKSEEKPKIPQIKSHTQKLKQINKSRERERETYWWDGGRTYEKWTQSFSEWGAQDQGEQANQPSNT